MDKFYLSDNKKIFQTEVLIAIVMFWLLFLILCCVCEMVSELNKDWVLPITQSTKDILKDLSRILKKLWTDQFRKMMEFLVCLKYLFVV